MEAPLSGFDFSVLDDPEYKEDAVREDIVAPLLRALGYGPVGPDRMVRSRALMHPYVSIGSIKRQIKIYPDYLLYAQNELKWVLDAKSPRESVDDPEHLSQTYTYAVHRDVRVDWYALCNGRDLAVYHVADMGSVPRLRVRVRDIASCWNDVKSLLLPPVIGTLGKPFAKDFGIHLLKLGIDHSVKLIFPQVLVPLLGRQGDRYTICVNTKTEASEYAACFDFGSDAYTQLLSIVSAPMRSQLERALENEPAIAFLQSTYVGIRAKVTRQILENNNEHYLPLEATGFFT